MNWLAAVLLTGVFLVNFTWRWLANEQYSQYAIWYMMQGAWIGVLCSIILILVSVYKDSLSKSLVVVAGWIGIIEGFKTAIARYFVVDPKLIPPSADIADYVTGLPIRNTLITLYLFMICYTYFAYTRNKNKSKESISGNSGT